MFIVRALAEVECPSHNDICIGSGDVAVLVRIRSRQSFHKVECHTHCKVSICGVYLTVIVDITDGELEKLETALQAHHELWDGLYDYWEEYFQSHSVEDFRRALTNTSGSCDDELELHVNLNIMACRYLKSDFERFAGTKTVNVFIGSAINANFRINNPSADMSSVCDVFRALGEKGKFDLLCRLAKKRSHCREIAAELDINPGTVSKMLSALYALGLVNSEHEDNKSYYTTNVEAFSSFLSIADRMVRSQQE